MNGILQVSSSHGDERAPAGEDLGRAAPSREDHAERPLLRRRRVNVGSQSGDGQETAAAAAAAGFEASEKDKRFMSPGNG